MLKESNTSFGPQSPALAVMTVFENPLLAGMMTVTVASDSFHFGQGWVLTLPEILIVIYLANSIEYTYAECFRDLWMAFVLLC